MISWSPAAADMTVNCSSTHLRVVLDQLGLLHDLHIPLTAIGFLGHCDADQLGHRDAALLGRLLGRLLLLLGIGHIVLFGTAMEGCSGRGTECEMVTRRLSAERRDVLVLGQGEFRGRPRELCQKFGGWGINNGTPPYRVPGYLSVHGKISGTEQSQTGPGLRLTRQTIDRLESCRSTSTSMI